MDEFLMKEILKNWSFTPQITISKNAAPDDEIPFCGLDCSECDICQEECFDCEFECEEEEPMMWGIPDVDRIIFNPPATIVFWDDGTKTVVKCMEDQPYEKYAGFAMACMKKMFGSTSRAKAIMTECDEESMKQFPEDQKVKQPEHKNKKREPVSVSDLTEAFEYVLKRFADRKEEKDGTPEA